MPYEVTIKTTNGDFQEQIDDITQLESVLIKYYDTYISVETKKVEKEKVKTLKRR